MVDSAGYPVVDGVGGRSIRYAPATEYDTGRLTRKDGDVITCEMPAKNYMGKYRRDGDSLKADEGSQPASIKQAGGDQGKYGGHWRDNWLTYEGYNTNSFSTTVHTSRYWYIIS